MNDRKFHAEIQEARLMKCNCSSFSTKENCLHRKSFDMQPFFDSQVNVLNIYDASNIKPFANETLSE